MHVAHANAHAVEVFRQVFRHALCERGHKRAKPPFRQHAHLGEQVVDLPRDRAHADLGIQKTRGANDLLRHLRGLGQLIVAGRRGHADHLRDAAAEFVEFERTVVERGREAEAVFDERCLARTVAAVHGADLRERDVRFVHKEQKILRKIVDERKRRFARPSAVKIAAVVLDAAAKADLTHHFQIVFRALRKPLRLDELAVAGQLLDAERTVPFNLLHGGHELFVARRVVRSGEDRDVRAVAENFARDRRHLADAVHLVPEELDPQRLVRPVRGENVQHVAAHAEGPARKIIVVALKLDIDETLDHLVAGDLHAAAQRDGQFQVFFRIAERVNAGYGRHDDDVSALVQRTGRAVAQLVDLVVDVHGLFNVGVRRGDICLRLVIVVIRNEVLHSGIRKKLLELGAELCGERLVVRDDERGLLHALDDLRHGEGLAAAGHAEQHLRFVAAENTL
ncbi:unknown [Clostridium sp. CAG:1024]|nr:unknown [Clostridium sp. CAG:1024]